jgi:hypothetical protein
MRLKKGGGWDQRFKNSGGSSDPLPNWIVPFGMLVFFSLVGFAIYATVFDI